MVFLFSIRKRIANRNRESERERMRGKKVCGMDKSKRKRKREKRERKEQEEKTKKIHVERIIDGNVCKQGFLLWIQTNENKQQNLFIFWYD